MEEGNLPRYTGGGEDLLGLVFNEGSTLLSRTHAAHLLPWSSCLGEESEDVGGGTIALLTVLTF